MQPLPLSQCQTLSSLAFERLDKSAWLMEPKVDGWRIQMFVSPDEVQAWTRTNHIATRKLPKPEMELQKIARHMHSSFLLDGEAVFIKEDGHVDYNFTSRCLGSGTEICIAKQAQRGFLSYFVFDVLMIGDHDLRSKPLHERKKAVDDIGYFRSDGFFVPVLGCKPSYAQHMRNIDAYEEGSVLKMVGAPYAGKRSKAWMKWKEFDTIDVRIVGYKEGQGKFEGLIGAIQFQAADGTLGSCSGMDDDTRIDISNHREAMLGQKIEIKHFGRLVDGYRHPQFVRFRLDK